MKLYATITSERASKGQGGNKYLLIELTIENDKGEYADMGQLKLYRVDTNPTGTALVYLPRKDHKIHYGTPAALDFLPDEKGKKQTGEKCYCSDEDMSIPHYH